ncbi:SdpI family protein [Bacillus sp. S2(2024)]|uniref:SdpI family protein n=1 Tax=Bacillus sp. S2(2024) TaxID=3162887 RepID=UPI003D21AC5B
MVERIICLSIPAFIIIISLLCPVFAKREPNLFIGYRTWRSMGSKEGWIKGNLQFGKYLFRIGCIYLFFTIGIVSFFKPYTGQMMIATMIGMVFTFGLSMYLTEKFLKGIGISKYNNF